MATSTLMAQSYADSKFKDAMCDILTLVSKSYDLFESSKTDQRRQLLGFVFGNLKLEGSSLRYILRKPFEVFSDLPNNPEWRAGQDESEYWSLELPAPRSPQFTGKKQ